MKNQSQFSASGLRVFLLALFVFAGMKFTAQCTASFTPVYNPGGNVTFNNNSVYPPGSWFQWAFGDGGTAWTFTAANTYSANGNYTATLSVWSNSFLCSTYTAVVSVTNSPCNQQLSTSFTGSAGLNGAYSASSTCTGTSPAATYSWSWGDGNSGAGPVASHTYVTNQWYNQILYLTDGGCSDSSSQWVYISPCNPMNANFTYTNLGNGVISFTSTTTGTVPSTTFQWWYGDGYNGTGSVVTHPYLNNGTYWVTLVASTPGGSMGCSSSYSTAITVANATCNLYASFTATSGPAGSYSVTSTSTGTSPSSTYAWVWGDGTTGNGIATAHTYSANGTYNVKLILTEAGCVDTSFAQAYISTVGCSLSAGFTYTNVGNGQINFLSTSTGTAPNTGYQWWFGDGATSNTINPSHTYQNNGTYSVSLYIYQPNGTLNPTCSSWTNTFITVSNATCNLTSNFTYTTGAYATLTVNSISTGTTPAATYSWTWGDGTSGTGANAVHSYSAVGWYSVWLKVTDVCVDSINYQIYADSCMIAAQLTFSNNINTYTFASISTGTNISCTYFWNFGDGTTGNGPVAVHQYSAAGFYSVTLSVSDPTMVPVCNSVTNYDVVICAMVAGFTYTNAPGGVVNFSSISTGTTPNTQYYWDFGDGNWSNLINPSNTYLNGGTHTVGLSLWDFGCSDSTYQSVNVNSIPCTANSNFTAMSSGTPLLWYAIPAYFGNVINADWYWGDGSMTNGLWPTHTYSAAGFYNICLSVTVSCAQSSSTCANYNIYRSIAPTDLSMAMATVQVVPSALVGLKPVSKDKQIDVHLYPNPSSGKFSINLQGIYSSSQEISISVSDLLGREVYFSKEEMSESFEKEIDLGKIEEGSYFLKVTSQNGIYSGKLLIRH